MALIELVGTIDEHHHLNLVVPEQMKAGAVKVFLEYDDDDDWRHGVAAIWARDWSDPREDIYTLDDGEPINDAG